MVDRLTRLALDWKATLPPGEEQPFVRPKAKPTLDRAAAFKAKDANRDGRLSLDEYLHNFPDEAEGRRRFPTFDTNHDNELTEHEFINMGRP